MADTLDPNQQLSGVEQKRQNWLKWAGIIVVPTILVALLGALYYAGLEEGKTATTENLDHPSQFGKSSVPMKPPLPNIEPSAGAKQASQAALLKRVSVVVSAWSVAKKVAVSVTLAVAVLALVGASAYAVYILSTSTLNPIIEDPSGGMERHLEPDVEPADGEDGGVSWGVVLAVGVAVLLAATLTWKVVNMFGGNNAQPPATGGAVTPGGAQPVGVGGGATGTLPASSPGVAPVGSEAMKPLAVDAVKTVAVDVPDGTPVDVDHVVGEPAGGEPAHGAKPAIITAGTAATAGKPVVGGDAGLAPKYLEKPTGDPWTPPSSPPHSPSPSPPPSKTPTPSTPISTPTSPKAATTAASKEAPAATGPPKSDKSATLDDRIKNYKALMATLKEPDKNPKRMDLYVNGKKEYIIFPANCNFLQICKNVNVSWARPKDTLIIVPKKGGTYVSSLKKETSETVQFHAMTLEEFTLNVPEETQSEWLKVILSDYVLEKKKKSFVREAGWLDNLINTNF